MSEERHPNNLIAMLLALIPGLSQVYLEHILLGAVFFSAFLTALNCLFLAGNLQSATNTHLLWQVSALSLIVIWIGSAWHAYALSYGTDRSGLARDRGQLLRLALLDYLKNDLEPAAVKLERAIELDVDWLDPDPLFHLGVVLLRLAEQRALDQDVEGSRVARRRSQWAFRTCLGRDRFGKWRREIRRETQRMRALLTSSGRGTSERLDLADTTLASFPELGESTSIPRAALGPDSSRYPRITPRPFSRRLLRERLEASGLEQDTVAAPPPEAETVALPQPGLEEGDPLAETLPPRDELLETSESSLEGLEDPDSTPPPLTRPSPGPSEPDQPPAKEQTKVKTKVKTKTKTKTETETEPAVPEQEVEDDPPAKPVATPTSDSEDLAATQPAQRLLPGESAPAPATSSEAEGQPPEKPLYTEDGMPATRLDVRPKDLLGDLIPATRQRSRIDPPEAITPYPETRSASRLRGTVRPDPQDPDAPSGSIPRTRHVSRAALGALRNKRPVPTDSGALDRVDADADDPTPPETGAPGAATLAEAGDTRDTDPGEENPDLGASDADRSAAQTAGGAPDTGAGEANAGADGTDAGLDPADTGQGKASSDLVAPLTSTIEGPDSEEPDSEEPDSEEPDSEEPDSEESDSEESDSEESDSEEPDSEESDSEGATVEVAPSDQDPSETDSNATGPDTSDAPLQPDSDSGGETDPTKEAESNAQDSAESEEGDSEPTDSTSQESDGELSSAPASATLSLQTPGGTEESDAPLELGIPPTRHLSRSSLHDAAAALGESFPTAPVPGSDRLPISREMRSAAVPSDKTKSVSDGGGEAPSDAGGSAPGAEAPTATPTPDGV